MHNFLRILRSSTKYHWTILGILTTSMLVALLWGANIGALFPVIQVALHRKPLQVWMDDKITDTNHKIDQLQRKIASLDAELANINDIRRAQEVGRRHNLAVHDLKTQNSALRTSQFIRPWLEYLPRDPFRTVMVVVLALVVGTAVKGFFIFCNLMLIARLTQLVTFDLRRRFFHQCLRLDQSAFGKERSSRLMSQFHVDVGVAASGVQTFYGNALREPLKMISCLTLACYISWRVLLFSLILTPITVFAISKLAGSIKRANRRSLEEISNLYGVLLEAFQGVETIHAFTLERNQRLRFFRVAKTCLQRNMRIALYSALTKPVTELLGICAIALAILSGAYLTINGGTHIGPIRFLDQPIDLATMLVFFGLLIGASEPARKLSDVFNTLQAGVAAADRLLPLLDRTPTIRSREHPTPLPKKIESITFAHVSFHYNAEIPVLIDVDLRIQAGETIAIVGPNGCGKTTMINLLPRFFDPISGSIRLNDVDLRDVRLLDLRRRIGMVTQRSRLFDDTVYNNIRYGRLDASQAEIVRAARQARADRFINEHLEHGYDTVIGPEGSHLSGGQRQRLALARAMVRDPEILILDEATSQIDLESEELIHQALEQFAVDRTVIMITHRLATLELAQRIVVMNHGRIGDVGTHDELMSRCDLYQRLHELQFRRSA